MFIRTQTHPYECYNRVHTISYYYYLRHFFRVKYYFICCKEGNSVFSRGEIAGRAAGHLQLPSGVFKHSVICGADSFDKSLIVVYV